MWTADAIHPIFRVPMGGDDHENGAVAPSESVEVKELNPRPTACKAAALPAELHPGYGEPGTWGSTACHQTLDCSKQAIR